MNKTNFKFQFIILAVGIVLMAAKFLAFYITESNAVLTDALESIINVMAGSFALFSLHLAAQPKDENHPYGHGKIEFISATIEGTMIFAAGLAIIAKSVYNFFDPPNIKALDLGIYISIATTVINFILGKIAEIKGKKSNSITLIAGGKHLQTDTYSTIGLIAGLIVIHFTQVLWLDSVAAILFSLFIIYTGYKIVRESISGIMDEADYQTIAKVINLINKYRKPEWIDVHNLRVIRYGGSLHVDCHITLPHYHSVQQGHDEIDELDVIMKQEFGATTETFIHTDPCIASSCRLCLLSDCKVRVHAFERKVDWNTENVMQNKKHK